MAHPGGRPRIQFDLEQVTKFGRIGLSPWEMAAFFGCHETTIQRLLRQPESEFCRAYALGKAEQNHALRAKLLEVAMRGNPFLLWRLAVSQLGYTERPAQVINVQQTAQAEPTPALVINEATKKRLCEIKRWIYREARREGGGAPGPES